MRKVIRNFVSSLAVMAAVAFAVSAPQAEGQTEKIIHSFAGGTDGGSPQGGLLMDASGNLYGVTETGGTLGGGTVYELTPGSGGIWSKTELYSFTFGTGDVSFPTSNLVSDAKGNLYGLSPEGGANGVGGVFELSPGSNGTWTEKVIYSFGGGTDVVAFLSYLTIDAEGNLYGYLEGIISTSGTTSYGSIFELQPNTSGMWTEKILHTFSGGSDGSAPYGGQLSIDSAGNLYGTANNGPKDFGLVFELVRGSNGSWKEKNLHTFLGAADGSASSGPLAIDASGNVFGFSAWNAFELVPASDGTWTENILHTFSGGSDGAYPESGATLSASGSVYGTTGAGGLHHGTVFQVTPHLNGTWTEKILHRFTTTGGDGINPYSSPLVIDTHGNLFGITLEGGISNNGVVFEVTP
jgi:hypothetical protein